MTLPFGRFAATLGVLLAASAASLNNGGIASAGDPLVGLTYGDASAQINKWKMHPVYSTIIGDPADMKKCIVTSWRKEAKTARIYLSLYCEEKVATAGNPGRSAASPEGNAAKKHDETVRWRQQHPEDCRQAKEQHPEWFKQPVEGCEDAFTSQAATSPSQTVEPAPQTVSSSPPPVESASQTVESASQTVAPAPQKVDADEPATDSP
ncbi:hypothetical protein ACJEIK_01310 [Mycobacterium sp. SMC-16]|uniref:hypothetical protein n=1 Tax=Mycobacteriaceae TaxID=1762 RepID=UPI000B0D6EEE|nr:hypothetical protein [Mycolicibacterium mucogenicum]